MKTSSLGAFSRVASVWDTWFWLLTWHMPFCCRFAVWCYLPRFARRLCWNESSKSCGKSCWTPSREQSFCLRWMTRVWVWLIICLFPFSVTLFISRPALHLPPLLHLSLSHFLHLFSSLLHNKQITVQKMKQHGISKSSHTCSEFLHIVNPFVWARLTFFISGISYLLFFVVVDGNRKVQFNASCQTVFISTISSLCHLG